MMLKRSFHFLFLLFFFISLTTFSWSAPTPRLPLLAAATVPAPRYPFYLGMLEDGNLIGGNPDVFRDLITELQSRGLDSIMFTNNDSERDILLLDVSDAWNFNVFMIPTGDLNREWWPEEVPANMETALAVAAPIIERWKPHPSLKGYMTKDEPGLHELEKVSLITQAFRSLDPSRPVMPILIGVNRVGPIFSASQADVLLIDVYPVGAQNAPCDLHMSGFGYPALDFVEYIRAMVQSKPASVPMWIILQTHNFLDQLREPIATELRLQHWLAIGEGAKSIFWFIYSSQQGWRGLRDNPELYAEVTSLTQRTIPLRDTLLELQKTDDLFTVSGTGSYSHYVSTLYSIDNKYYVMAVNRDCQNAQHLVISSIGLSGQLREVETNAVYSFESPIVFLPGDGKLFELITTQEPSPTDTATQTVFPLTSTETLTLTPTDTLTSAPIFTDTATNPPPVTRTFTETVTPTQTPPTSVSSTPPSAPPLPSPDTLYPILEEFLRTLLDQLRHLISGGQT